MPDAPAIRPGTDDTDAIRSTNQRIFETTLDLILVVDRRGNFIRVSPSSARILGYAAEEMVGHNATEFLYPPDLESTRGEMRLARHGRLTRNFETRYVHKTGRVVTLAWTGIWSEPEQQHFFIGRDMTERIAAEEMLRQSQRLEAIGQLTGGIAHDFNNLLGVVMGNLDLLQELTPENSEAATLVKEALDACLSGAELNRRLLAFARRQPLQPKVVEINGLVGGMAKLLGRTLGEDIEIKLSLASDLWPVEIDPAQLESALTNLAVNARDPMPSGGSLVIATRNTQLDADYAEANVEVTPGDYVLLEVTDAGAGMAPEVMSRVFEPFFTTKELGKGTGLGLSMVFGFVRQSGGHIKIYSEVGFGTTVRIYLPRVEAQPAKPAPSMSAPLPKAVGRQVVLAVEDDDQLRRVLMKQLKELGYSGIAAENGPRALEDLRGDEKIDLLLTDIVMPGGIDGTDLAQVAMHMRPELKVLFTSGFPQVASGQIGIVSADQMLLSKPYRKQDLAEALRAALSR
jgi:PAS domain S-box-containing protein